MPGSLFKFPTKALSNDIEQIMGNFRGVLKQLVLRLQLDESLLDCFVHQAEFSGNLLVVTSGKNFVEFLHGLVVSFNVLSLRLNFGVKLKSSGYYVLGLNDKVIKVLLLTGQCGTGGALRFFEAFLNRLQSLQVD